MVSKWKLSVRACWMNNGKTIFTENLKIYGQLCSNFYRDTCILFDLETPSWQNGNSASSQLCCILPATVYHILHCLGSPGLHTPLPLVNAEGFLGLVLGQWHLGESQLCRAFANVCSTTQWLLQRAYFLNCQRNTCGIAETREKLSILLLNWHSTHATFWWQSIIKLPYFFALYSYQYLKFSLASPSDTDR